MEQKIPDSDDPIVSTEPRGIVDWCIVILFVAIVVVMLLSIFFRYVLNDSLPWTDETIRFAFVWFTLLGAALLFRDRTHIRVDYLLEKFPPGIRRRIEELGYWLMTVFHLFLFIAGLVWVWKTQGTQMSSLRLPLNWCFYFALPATSALTLWFSWRHWQERGKEGDNS